MKDESVPEDVVEEETVPIPRQTNKELVFGLQDTPRNEEFLRDNVKDILDWE